MTKMCLWSFMAYAQNEVGGTVFVFWVFWIEMRTFEDFHIWNLDNGNFLGGKVQFSVYIHIVRFINFPE